MTPRPATPTTVVTVAPTASTPVPTTVASAFAPPDPVEGVGEVREALIGGNIFQLEVARTAEETRRGLMDRPSLLEDAAMLFVYERERNLIFWMKNTLIPLDILFLDAEGVVVDVQTMHPQPGATDAVLRRYPSAHPARYAIEMNAGLADEYGIVPGAQVLFR